MWTQNQSTQLFKINSKYPKHWAKPNTLKTKLQGLNPMMPLPKKKKITINQKESQLKQEYSKWTKWFIIVFETGCICDLVLSSLKSFHYYAFLNVDHAVRINIHNNKFISEHKKLIRTFRRSVVSSDYVSHRVAPNSISVSQIPKLIANLKKTIE